MEEILESRFETKKLAEWWFDLSKIVVASLVLKFFEPGDISLDKAAVVTVFTGVVIFVGCVNMGRMTARRVENNE